jgi:hypothetical protein
LLVLLRQFDNKRPAYFNLRDLWDARPPLASILSGFSCHPAGSLKGL